MLETISAIICVLFIIIGLVKSFEVLFCLFSGRRERIPL